MKAVVVLLGLLLTTTLVHAEQAWKIDPPDGWAEDKESAVEQVEKLRKMTGVNRAEFRQWNAPEGNAALQVLELDADKGDHSGRAMIDGMETGAVKGVDANNQISLTRREENNQIIVDHVIEVNDRRVHMQRHYAVDDQGTIHNVTVTCAGPTGAEVPACTQAFASFKMLVKAVPLAGSRWTDPKFIGGVIGVALLVVIVVWLLVRKKQ